MRNAFYYYGSATDRTKNLLLNEEGYSPFTVGYGYRLAINGQGNNRVHAIVPVSAEVSVIQRVFHDFVSGRSITRIVEELNQADVPTRLNRGWNYNSVSNILKNETYIGIFTFHKCEFVTTNDGLKYNPRRFSESHKEQIPDLGVISLDKWNQVQHIRIKRCHRLTQSYSPTRKINKPRCRRRANRLPNYSSQEKIGTLPYLLSTILGAFLPLRLLGMGAKVSITTK